MTEGLAFVVNWTTMVLAGEAPPAANGGSGSIWPLLLPMLVIFVMYQIMVSRPQRKEQSRRDEMLKTLKKNDPVVTIGGILGTVANISDDGSEVTLRVDDGARIRFRRDAIREVTRKPDEGAPEPGKA